MARVAFFVSPRALSLCFFVFFRAERAALGGRPKAALLGKITKIPQNQATDLSLSAPEPEFRADSENQGFKADFFTTLGGRLPRRASQAQNKAKHRQFHA